MDLPREILELLKKKASMPHDYINPNFIQDITEALYVYYELEDDIVDKWQRGMWEC